MKELRSKLADVDELYESREATDRDARIAELRAEAKAIVCAVMASVADLSLGAVDSARVLSYVRRFLTVEQHSIVERVRSISAPPMAQEGDVDMDTLPSPADELENPGCPPATLANSLYSRILDGLSEGSAPYRVATATELRRLVAESEERTRATMAAVEMLRD